MNNIWQILYFFKFKFLRVKHLPSAGVIFKSGSKLLKKVSIKILNPLKTESTITSAIVPTMIPPTEMAEMMLMIFCFFFETKYLLAMNNGKFNVLYLN
jgi:hypothetical protein